MTSGISPAKVKAHLIDASGNSITTSNRLPVDAQLTVEDIEIGAVELKDHTSDARAPVSATNGLTVDLGTNNDVTVTGTVAVSGDAANTSRTTSTVVLPVQIVDSAGRVYKADGITNAIQSIDYSHHEIHSGTFFNVSYYGTSKNDGQTINVYIKTPNTTKWGHLFFDWSCGGAAFGRMYEAPTITSNTGTNAQPIINHHRNVATTSDMLDNATSPAANCYGYDVTKTGNGTILYIEYAGAAKSEGGQGRNEHEIILKQNTAYLFEVESDASGLTLSLNLYWYEHTNG